MGGRRARYRPADVCSVALARDSRPPVTRPIRAAIPVAISAATKLALRIDASTAPKAAPAIAPDRRASSCLVIVRPPVTHVGHYHRCDCQHYCCKIGAFVRNIVGVMPPNNCERVVHGDQNAGHDRGATDNRVVAKSWPEARHRHRNKNKAVECEGARGDIDYDPEVWFKAIGSGAPADCKEQAEHDRPEDGNYHLNDNPSPFHALLNLMPAFGAVSYDRTCVTVENAIQI